jgi:hypothetical protein
MLRINVGIPAELVTPIHQLLFLQTDDACLQMLMLLVYFLSFFLSFRNWISRFRFRFEDLDLIATDDHDNPEEELDI